MNYYNEIDPFAAAWLRELVKQKLIPNGDVDERDIRDITPAELSGYTQCHFFAGIGGWSLALQRAGWPEDKPVWTGSCPCQPFSSAGKGAGFDDERHLWPSWFHLIQECKPEIVFGEQVASKDGLAWLDLVSADMEGADYAFGAADLCVAGIGGPHIRQRLWFVGMADTYRKRLNGFDSLLRGNESRRDQEDRIETTRSSQTVRMADTSSTRLQGGERIGATGTQGSSSGHRIERSSADRMGNSTSEGSQGITGGLQQSGRTSGCEDGGMAYANGTGAQCWSGNDEEAKGFPEGERQSVNDTDVSERSSTDHNGLGDVRGDGISCDAVRPRPTNGFWRDADWLFCRDGLWRSVEPGTQPLADGIPARMGRLRGYGNAISPEVGATFIEAVVEAMADAN